MSLKTGADVDRPSAERPAPGTVPDPMIRRRFVFDRLRAAC